MVCIASSDYESKHMQLEVIKAVKPSKLVLGTHLIGLQCCNLMVESLLVLVLLLHQELSTFEAS